MDGCENGVVDIVVVDDRMDVGVGSTNIGGLGVGAGVVAAVNAGVGGGGGIGVGGGVGICVGEGVGIGVGAGVHRK